MAAKKTVSQVSQSHNSPIRRHGVVTLFGYGLRVSVDRGHLLASDGIGRDRHEYRFPRVGHGLRRLVVIGSDGMVSLAALRWLADQNASFVMLNRDGSVLATTGPVSPSDAKLRRAQALAGHSGVAVKITRELISQKLAGQEHVIRNKLLNTTSADEIARLRADVPTATNLATIRLIESQAAAAYWSVWSPLSINFPRNDLSRVPDHWRIFGTRKSPLSGSPRLAAHPANAILNYLYALLESEARLAASALGLDPGLGVLHVDTPNRDSLACDLMEPIRPLVDAFVLDWITREPLKRNWFFEQRDGNCRLMAPFTAQLSETAPTWARAVAPFAEWVAQTLSASKGPRLRQFGLSTPLTQRNRYEAKEPRLSPITENLPLSHHSICRVCGTPIAPRRTYCAECAVTVSREKMSNVALIGRKSAHTPPARARRGDAQRRHHAAKRFWVSSNQPAWLNEATYEQKIRPLLAGVSSSAIASVLGVSLYYASDIRRGRCRPHPRHWQAIAQLIGISEEG
jgi:CRISPR-associated endonuclease Cas1